MFIKQYKILFSVLIFLGAIFVLNIPTAADAYTCTYYAGPTASCPSCPSHPPSGECSPTRSGESCSDGGVIYYTSYTYNLTGAGRCLDEPGAYYRPCSYTSSSSRVNVTDCVTAGDCFGHYGWDFVGTYMCTADNEGRDQVCRQMYCDDNGSDAVCAKGPNTRECVGVDCGSESYYCSGNDRRYRDYWCSSGSCQTGTSLVEHCADSNQTCVGNDCVNRYSCVSGACTKTTGGSYTTSTCNNLCAPLPAPFVVTLDATNITTTTATLNGTADPNGYATNAGFRWGTSNVACASLPNVTATQPMGSGSTAIGYSTGISGLTPNTDYFFCAVGSSANGSDSGSVLSFTTNGTVPTVTTLVATSITTSSAILNGSVNPNGFNSDAWFRYSTTNPGPSCNDTFGTRVPVASGVAMGSGNVAVNIPGQSISGLFGGTTYYYCALASNVNGMGLGAVMTFTSPIPPPIVTTDDATNKYGTTARLNGTVNVRGFYGSAWFRYSSVDPGPVCNNTFGIKVPDPNLPDNIEGNTLSNTVDPQPYYEDISGLTEGVTYYYCAIANNGVMGFGAVKTFVAVRPVLQINLLVIPDPTPEGDLTQYLTDIILYSNGDPTDTINYTFWWNCTNVSTDVAVVIAACGEPFNDYTGTGDINVGYKIDGILDDPYIAGHYISAGAYMAKVIVERDSALSVEDRQAYTVQAMPDLILASYNFSPLPVQPGNVMNFTATARNTGGAGSGVSAVRMRIDVDNDGTWNVTPADQVLNPLSAGLTQVVTWNSAWTAAPGIHKLEICADPTNSVAESDETNNCSTQTFTVGFCVDECVPSGVNQCYSVRTYQDCGEYDLVNGTTEDSCLEWGPENPDITPPDTPCPPKNTCVAGVCIPTPTWIEVAPKAK